MYCFRFTILQQNKIKVYCTYKIYKTYKLNATNYRNVRKFSLHKINKEKIEAEINEIISNKPNPTNNKNLTKNIII